MEALSESEALKALPGFALKGPQPDEDGSIAEATPPRPLPSHSDSTVGGKWLESVSFLMIYSFLISTNVLVGVLSSLPRGAESAAESNQVSLIYCRSPQRLTLSTTQLVKKKTLRLDAKGGRHVLRR